jgi:hypothetical protein
MGVCVLFRDSAFFCQSDRSTHLLKWPGGGEGGEIANRHSSKDHGADIVRRKLQVPSLKH